MNERSTHAPPRRGAPALRVSGAAAALLATTMLSGPVRADTESIELDALDITAPAPALTAESAEDARRRLERTPGGVDLVPAEDFRNKRAVTTKDMLDFTPGVFAQPQYGEESRLSIRGSGLSQNFHLRGIRLLQDGVPLNRPDGFGDFQEIDPLAFSHVEVFKGANALQYGATTLGGAINFVTPTGRTADRAVGRAEYGSFDFHRIQGATGDVVGDWDYFLTGNFMEQDGFRDHSDSESLRLNANVGHSFGAGAETRFYVTYNEIDQALPGSVTREQALDDPEAAFPGNVANDFRRDIDSLRLSNKTSFLIGDSGKLDLGGFYSNRELHHPIFLVLDNETETYGGFGRYTDAFEAWGHRNEFVVGSNIHAGTTDDLRFVNVGGKKGPLVDDLEESAFNLEVYAENRFFLREDVALILGGQLAHNVRDTDDRLIQDGDDTNNRDTFTNFDPKFGVLWDVRPDWQVFGNVSRSTEVPTFIALNPTAQDDVPEVEATKATTVELGTRGRRGRFAWDVAVYRSWVKDEIQLFNRGQGRTFVQNADETIHQGIELGVQADIVRGLLADEGSPDTLSLNTAYTFSDFRFQDDPTFGDNQLPGAPRHYLRAELLYEHPSGFYVGPNVEWVPEGVYADNANTVQAPDYALLGARAGMDLPYGASVFIDGRNLTDKTFIANTNVLPVAGADDAIFDPGDGLSVTAGLEVRW